MIIYLETFKINVSGRHKYFPSKQFQRTYWYNTLSEILTNSPDIILSTLLESLESTRPMMTEKIKKKIVRK